MARQNEKNDAFEGRLLPILREGVDVVKMILFVELKKALAASELQVDPVSIPRLAGLAINELFGTVNPDPALVAFRAQHLSIIEETLQGMNETMAAMRIPVSDALRVAVLCDYQENGTDTTAVLTRARDLGVLLMDRDLPLPHRFLDLVRRLGKAHGLIVPPMPEAPADPV